MNNVTVFMIIIHSGICSYDKQEMKEIIQKWF